MTKHKKCNHFSVQTEWEVQWTVLENIEIVQNQKKKPDGMKSRQRCVCLSQTPLGPNLRDRTKLFRFDSEVLGVALKSPRRKEYTNRYMYPPYSSNCHWSLTVPVNPTSLKEKTGRRKAIVILLMLSDSSTSRLSSLCCSSFKRVQRVRVSTSRGIWMMNNMPTCERKRVTVSPVIRVRGLEVWWTQRSAGVPLLV